VASGQKSSIERPRISSYTLDPLARYCANTAASVCPMCDERADKAAWTTSGNRLLIDALIVLRLPRPRQEATPFAA
jgi:hypothetical protein